MGVWLKAGVIDWCWIINYIYLFKPMLHLTLTKASTLGSQSFMRQGMLKGIFFYYKSYLFPNSSILLLTDFNWFFAESFVNF